MVIHGGYIELDDYDFRTTGLPMRVPLAAAGVVLETCSALFAERRAAFVRLAGYGPDANPPQADAILDGVMYSDRVVRFLGSATSEF